jgi:hypothetical protein
MASVTSANAILTLSIAGLFNAPVQIQGFQTDDVYSVEPLDAAEVMMGVDGVLTGGFIHVPVTVGYALMADSSSISFFDTWWLAQQQINDLYFANGVIRLKSIGRLYTLTKGILKTYPPIADGGKTLKGRKFTVTWQSISPAPI